MAAAFNAMHSRLDSSAYALYRRVSSETNEQPNIPQGMGKRYFFQLHLSHL